MFGTVDHVSVGRSAAFWGGAILVIRGYGTLSTMAGMALADETLAKNC